MLGMPEVWDMGHKSWELWELGGGRSGSGETGMRVEAFPDPESSGKSAVK